MPARLRSEAEKARDREYMRLRRQDPAFKNRERETQKRYRQTEAYREHAREYNRHWLHNDPLHQERNRARARKWLNDPTNQNRNRQRATNWQNDPANRERRLTNSKLGEQRRRARLAHVENTFTKADWQILVARSKHCHWCKRSFTKREPPTHDHVIPIAKGGPNTLANSCCAHKRCNSRKNARLINPTNGQGILL